MDLDWEQSAEKMHRKQEAAHLEASELPVEVP